MAEINSSAVPYKRRSFKRLAHRHSTKVDLTPMVDLGFLLITFFVFTTSMSQPTAMTLLEPKDGDATPVKESGAMTIILGKDHQVYYYYGKLTDAAGAHQIKKANLKDARILIAKQEKSTAMGDLMFIIKSGSNASFGDNIDILDEMTICNIPAGHYAEMDLTDAESQLIFDGDKL